MAIYGAHIEAYAVPIIKIKVNSSVPDQLRIFKAHFGLSPLVIAAVWNRLEDEALLPANGTPLHLLWTLLFLKLYNTAAVLSTMCGTTAKTYRQWVWKLLQGIHHPPHPLPIRLSCSPTHSREHCSIVVKLQEE